ncbi:YjbH domain-containing protein [Yoonia sp. SS1-5]|uniref:YjbH domain-containing protein n=1 Tax=Yoonia rhodophyticola TaxID=3137370 RepID=A0AAN0MCW1_9RHOB
MQKGLYLAILAGLAAQAVAADEAGFRYNTYGAPGLIDLPTARSAPDAELAFTVSHFADQTRSTATFQLAPRLSASFRYAGLNGVRAQNGLIYDRVLDRSFALHYRLSDETARWPAIAVGLNDFLGTGIYSSEYVVASKTLRPGVTVTGGLGWGRLSGVGAIGAPFGDRPIRDLAQGGNVTRNTFFSGDVAPFGGVHWQMTRRAEAVLEYSSDAYPFEDGVSFDRKSQINAGLSYALRPNLHLSVYYLYGAEIGAQLSYAINPGQSRHGGGYDTGPVPVVTTPRMADLDKARLRRDLAADGMTLQGLSRQGARLHVAIANDRYIASAQAIGRAARILTAHAPAGVSAFEITLVENGVAGETFLINRADLGRYEFALDGAGAVRARTVVRRDISRNPARGGTAPNWSIGPYLTTNLFDPDNPLRADLGIALDGRWSPVQGLVFAGTVRQRVTGNLDQATRMSDSILPRVRSDFALYDREGDLDLIDLTAAWYAQPSDSVTTRLSFGLLEEMFAGVSSEVLWSPPNSPFALGLEFNHVRQRDVESDFDILDYDVTSGHASLYWDMGAGYHVRLDAGRYLAGDWGGTLTFARSFDNGWMIGAFATLTDVPFEDFGEGSFDKGIQLRIPVSWISGAPTRAMVERTIRPVTRDGGARLNIEGRLYDVTRPLSQANADASWGRFWR